MDLSAASRAGLGSRTALHMTKSAWLSPATHRSMDCRLKNPAISKLRTQIQADDYVTRQYLLLRVRPVTGLDKITRRLETQAWPPA